MNPKEDHDWDTRAEEALKRADDADNAADRDAHRKTARGHQLRSNIRSVSRKASNDVFGGVTSGGGRSASREPDPQP